MRERTWWMLISSVALLGVVMAFSACDPPPSNTKTRVPTMPSEQHQPVPPPKEDSLQVTSMGTIVEAGEERSELDLSKGWYLSFTFQEDSGFRKKFFPVCDGTTLPINQHIGITFHWKPWTSGPDESYNRSGVGCFYIDGYQMK
jgi:hypothetical protein